MTKYVLLNLFHKLMVVPSFLCSPVRITHFCVLFFLISGLRSQAAMPWAWLSLEFFMSKKFRYNALSSLIELKYIVILINKVQIILSLLMIIKFKATNNSFNLDISLLIILIVSIRKLRSIDTLFKIKTLTI